MTLRGRWLRAAALATLPFAKPALAQDLTLLFPLDCTLGNTCYIQQYVDRDPGSGHHDYQCNGLSYDGHKGTDFAVNTRAIMNAGVKVLAAADGIVRGYRDGMSDAGFSAATSAEIEGRECGNGVVLTHPGGWETQYCHLKEGSLNLRNGQAIAAGDVLGEVGQSGRAEFPHLHFSVRKDGKPVDPFDPDGELLCQPPGGDTLWADPPPYLAGGIIDAGFSDRLPSYESVKAGTATNRALPSDARALVVFGFTYGTRKGDVLRLEIDGPAGEVITQDTTLERNHAQAFRAVGKRRRGWAKWDPGSYVGTATLLRDGQVISQRQARLTVVRAE